jgi:hypothetical protein
MDRNNSVNDSQTRELTEAELDVVSGGAIMVENPTAMVDAFSHMAGSGGGAGKSTAVIAII